MFKDFTFSQKCVLIKTDAPFGPLDSVWACQRSNNMCRSVRCQPGLINRGEITINKKKTIFNRCCCWLVPWSWLWLGTLTLDLEMWMELLLFYFCNKLYVKFCNLNQNHFHLIIGYSRFEGYPRSPHSDEGLIPRANIFYIGSDP